MDAAARGTATAAGFEREGDAPGEAGAGGENARSPRNRVAVRLYNIVTRGDDGAPALLWPSVRSV
jgi:hypothetical protein